MAQHDYNIANGSGLTVRTDINAVLSAILTNNSGATAPTTTQPFMWWYDTSTSLLKMRNAANTAWVTIIPITAALASKLETARTINGVSFDGSANINIEDRKGANIASAATTTIGTTGLGDYIHITGTTTITSFGTASAAGVRRTLIFDGALTITHHATNLICMGATNIVTVANTIIEVVAETTTTWRVVSITHPALSMAELSYLDGVESAIQTQLNGKQATLVSGTNIKTVNEISLLGSGNVVITQNPSAVFANSQTFTASGTFTVPAGVTKIMVLIAHGGGGGGGGRVGDNTTTHAFGTVGGGGGGSNFEAPIFFDVAANSTHSVVVASGGAGGSAASLTDGGKGGISSFGTYTPTNYSISNGGSVSALNSGSSGGGGSPYGFYGGASGSGGMGVGSGQGYTGSPSATTGCIGGKGTANNGSNSSNTSASNGSAGSNGGAGGAGKVIVYW